MKYQIFKREIYKNHKTGWEDTGKMVEAEKSAEAIDKWLDEYSPAVLYPEGYGAGRRYFSRNYGWEELRDFNASPLYPEEEYFSTELMARRVK